MTDVRMKLSLRTVDGKVVEFSGEAYPASMTIREVLAHAERLQGVSRGDVQLTCIETKVTEYKAQLDIIAGRDHRGSGAETSRVVTVTSGFEESASDSKGGGSSKEVGGSLTAGWSGLYFAASATASTNFVTTSNWTNSRTKSLSTSESTETKFFFPSHAQTQYAKWFVEVPDKNKKLRKFFLPGPTIAFRNGKDHIGETMQEVLDHQPNIKLRRSATGLVVDDGTGTTEIPRVRKAGDWFRIVNGHGDCLHFPGETGSSTNVQLEVRTKEKGSVYNQQFSWAGGDHPDGVLDKLECRWNEKKGAGNGGTKLYVSVWGGGSTNGSRVRMYKDGANGGATWQSQKWSMNEHSIVSGSGLILTTKDDGGSGSKVQLWEDTGDEGQDWFFEYISDE